MPRKLVLFDHDGGVDDLLSLMLLLTMPHIDMVGVCVTPADSFLPFALESTRKILGLFQRDDIAVAAGDLHGVNPFPRQWRAGPHIINALPMVLAQPVNPANLSAKPAREFIADTLANAPEPVTVLMTGPPSNLVAALQAQPDLAANIAEVVWMGGALKVTGNVRDYTHNGTAEWNAYWDPPATQALLAMNLPLTLFPLDVTNHVPVSLEFLQQLAVQQDYALSHLAGQFWATTINTIPHYDYQYFMWDILATGYLGNPDSIQFERMAVTAQVSLPNAGQTVVTPGSGQWVNVAHTVDVPDFHQYLLAQFKRDF